MTEIELQLLGLTKMDERILLCIAEGYQDKQIALKFGCSLPGAKRQVGNILKHLRAVNRANAVYIGIKEGIIDPLK